MMNSFESLPIKRAFLYALITSISVSAFLGIWVILSGNYDEISSRVLLTTLTVAVTSVFGLASGTFIESRRAQNSSLIVVPIGGIISAILTALLWLKLIWFPNNNWSDLSFKLAICAPIFAFALAHLSLLSLARLAARYQWALVVAYIAILFLAFFFSFVVFVEPRGMGLGTFQLIGVAAVIDAAFSIMIPIFHRLSRRDFQFADKTTVDELDAEINNLKQQLADLEQRRREILDL